MLAGNTPGQDNFDDNAKLVDSYNALDSSSSTYLGDLGEIAAEAATVVEEQDKFIHSATNVTAEQLAQHDALMAVISKYSELSDATEKATENSGSLALSLSDTLSKLSTAKDNISALAKAFKEL